MRRRRIASAVILGLGLGVGYGCAGAPSTDVFLEKYLDRYCKYRQKCYEAEFRDDFGSIGSCVSRKLEYKSFSEFSDDCTDFDSKEAEECLVWLYEMRNPCEPLDFDALDQLDDNCSNVCDYPGFVLDLSLYAIEGGG